MAHVVVTRGQTHQMTSLIGGAEITSLVGRVELQEMTTLSHCGSVLKRLNYSQFKATTRRSMRVVCVCVHIYIENVFVHDRMKADVPSAAISTYYNVVHAQ